MRPRIAALFVALVATASPARAYIAVPADRLTLPEVMLEFPTVLLLTLDKSDEAQAAFVFAVTEAIQGVRPEKPVRMALTENGKVPKRLAGMPKGATVVAFLGSPDNRSLVCADGGWFLTRPNQGWERLTQFRDDFPALYAGPPAELAAACRSLARGGVATVPVRSKGMTGDVLPHVRYDAQFPHRRWPAVDPTAKPRTAAEVGRALTDKGVGVRHRAAVERAALPDAEADLLTALRDAHPEVRAAAAAGLGQQTVLSTPAVVALAKAVADDDRFVCGFAAWALGRAGAAAKPALPALTKALGDRNYDHDFRPHRAAEAAEALVRVAPDDADSVKRAVQFFLSDRMLADGRIDSEGTRTAAARALGRCGSAAKAALPELTKRLTDPLPATRVAAAEAVYLTGGDPTQRVAAAKVLTAAFAAGDTATRVQALRAAAAVRDKALVPAVRKWTDDKDAVVKSAARAAETALAD